MEVSNDQAQQELPQTKEEQRSLHRSGGRAARSEAADWYLHGDSYKQSENGNQRLSHKLRVAENRNKKVSEHSGSTKNVESKSKETKQKWECSKKLV